MPSTKLGWLVSFLIGCLFIAGVVVAFQSSRVGGRNAVLSGVPEDAGRIYQQRIRATETLLEGGFLEVSDSRGR